MKFYKCEVCGNIVEKVVDHQVPVMCCGKPMSLLEANVTEAATEKHIPEVSFNDGVLDVVIAEVEHPSLPAHFINFIVVKAGDQVYRKDLKAGDKPAASFNLNGYKGNVEVYEFCNLHGLWKKEITVE